MKYRFIAPACLMAILTIVGVLMAFGKAEPPGWSKISEIGMTATSCFGVCPAYEVSFTNGGSARLIWKPPHRKIIILRDSLFAHIAGGEVSNELLASRDFLIFTGRISAETFNSLAQILESKDFFDMVDHIEKVTDLPSFNFSATSENEIKKIKMYGTRPPQSMLDIKSSIEETIAKIDWDFEKTIENR